MQDEIKKDDEIGLQPNKRPIYSFNRFPRPLTPINIPFNISIDDDSMESQEIKIDV